MENNTPSYPSVSPQQLPENSSGSKQLIEAILIEGVFLFLVALIIVLFLNYYNIIPISKNINALGFLPHQTIFDTTATLVNAPAPIPTPTPYSHKIADMPIDAKMIPIFSPDKEQVIFESPEGNGPYIIPSCSICNNLVIAKAGFNYKTNKLTLIGVSKIDNSVHLILDNKELQKMPNLKGIGAGLNHFATWDWENGNIVYYIDGVEKIKYSDPQQVMKIADISFSADGSQNGYILLNNAQATTGKVFINGIEQPFTGRNFSFAPQGNNYAYIGTSGPLKEFLVLNGIKQNEYLEIGNNIFFDQSYSNSYIWSPDGKRIAYTARKAQGNFINGKWDSGEYAVVVDGKEMTGGFRIIKYLLFSPNSKRFAFASQSNNYMRVYLDGKIMVKLSASIITEMNGIYFSPDSKRFVYAISGLLFEGEWNPNLKEYGMKNGHIYALAFSPNSKRIGYTSQLKMKGSNKVISFIDGKEYSGGSPYRAPAFSPDSKHVVYWEGINYNNPYKYNGKLYVVLDNVSKTEITDPYGFLKEDYYLFSPSRASTYRYLQPTSFPTEILNSFTFTKDSKYVKFNAIRGKEYWVIVVDTQTGKEVIDKNTPIPTDLPLPTAIPIPTNKI